MKIILAALLIIAVFMVSCRPANNSLPPSEQSPATISPTETKYQTEFARMLGYVPYSFLEEQDIWFANWLKAKQLHGVEDITTLEELLALPEELRKTAIGFLSETGGSIPRWRNSQLAPIIGFDSMLIDRIIYSGSIPPRSFSISEANFDEELIASKLIDLGYTQTNYNSYSYYGIRDDYDMDLTHPLGKMVLNSMNRIAIFDDTFITAPATSDVTGSLDAMEGETRAVIDEPTCRAVVESLGEVIQGVVMLPEQVLGVDDSSQELPFYFAIPSDWGLLHQYEMVGMGYRDDGDKRYWDISLYYPDIEDARADSLELVKRMNSYLFATQLKDNRNVEKPLTSRYTVGDPVVIEYAEGAVLTVSSQLAPGRLGAAMDMGGLGLHDLLFLVPDPRPYVRDPASAPQRPQPEITIAPPDLTFSKNMMVTIGSEPGYNDAAHQQITFNITIRNDSTDTIKNVRVNLSTMATNDAQKPLIIQGQPRTPGHVDFEPGQSETYNIAWKFDGSNYSKEEISRLVEETKVVVEYVGANGEELTQALYPDMP